MLLLREKLPALPQIDAGEGDPGMERLVFAARMSPPSALLRGNGTRLSEEWKVKLQGETVSFLQGRIKSCQGKPKSLPNRLCVSTGCSFSAGPVAAIG